MNERLGPAGLRGLRGVTESEQAVTLVELLVAITITAVIASAIAAAFVLGLRTTDASTDRIARSHDRLLTSSYFGADVESAQSASSSDTTCAAGQLVVRFRWVDPGASAYSTDDVDRLSSYSIVTAFGEKRLVRRLCEKPVSGATFSTVNEVVVAHNLGAAPPVASCSLPACTLTLTDTGAQVWTLSARNRSA